MSPRLCYKPQSVAGSHGSRSLLSITFVDCRPTKIFPELVQSWMIDLYKCTRHPLNNARARNVKAPSLLLRQSHDVGGPHPFPIAALAVDAFQLVPKRRQTY